MFKNNKLCLITIKYVMDYIYPTFYGLAITPLQTNASYPPDKIRKNIDILS